MTRNLLVLADFDLITSDTLDEYTQFYYSFKELYYHAYK